MTTAETKQWLDDILTGKEGIKLPEKIDDAQSLLIEAIIRLKTGKFIAKPDEDPAVNHPSHYNKGGIETLTYIQTRLSPEGFLAGLRFNIIKYIDRAPDKGTEKQDYKKARYYLDELIKLLP